MDTKEKTSRKVLKILGYAACVLFCLGWLGSCAFIISSVDETHSKTNPEKSEYVGVWACCRVTADQGEINFENIEEAQSFLQLFENGEAKEIVVFSNGTMNTQDGQWVRTEKNIKEGTDAGIIIRGDTDDNRSFNNPYKFVTGNPNLKVRLVDAPLIDGHLVIIYENHTDFLEKISNDPNYQPWLKRITDTAATEQNDKTPNESSTSNGTLIWNEAKEHIGETVTVFGSVVDSEYASSSNGKPTFLDVGMPYPDSNRLTLVIWGEDRSAFPVPPEKAYAHKDIRVTGVPYIYDGVCHIKISSPSQIQVL